MDFDYKKYSLENLEKWIEDAINSSDASPQEIFDVIKNVVTENYYCYKNHTARCYELLALLNGNGNSFNIDPKGNNVGDLIENPVFDIGNPWDNMSSSSFYGNFETSSLICDKDDKSTECQKSWNDFWEENYSLEKSSQYTEEELDAMCEKAKSDDEKRHFIKETSETVTSGASVSPKEDKVVMWKLPVEVDGLTGECYISLPDDLLKAAKMNEGDTIRWNDCSDGSFKITKVTKPIKMEDC